MTPPPEAGCVDLTLDAPPVDPEWTRRVVQARAATASTRLGAPRLTWLFDGDDTTHWRSAGVGAFVAVGDRLESVPGDDLGLYWCTIPAPSDFVLQLEWLRWRHDDGSGVFVRFPRPAAGPFGNPAFTAIHRGFEIQLDEIGPPGGSAIHRTGAIFNEPDQHLTAPRVRPPAEWNEIEVAVRGQHYRVSVNGAPCCEFDNRDGDRGLPGTPAVPSFIGLQLSPGSRVAFRRIAIRPL